jgi:tetratricopeptide (TPR) repeat protein
MRGTLGSDHTATLDTINTIGILYRKQGQLQEAEKMYQRELAGTEKGLGPDYTDTLDTIKNIGNFYSDQDKLKRERRNTKQTYQSDPV